MHMRRSSAVLVFSKQHREGRHFMSNELNFNIEEELHEECGVFGIYDFDGSDVASTIYYGLFALQHRGQESCGIAVSDTEGPKGKVSAHKGMGLCNEVFTPDVLEDLHGNIGVGHVRYSTAGSSTRENAQPLVLNYVKGTLAMAHNGNLVNAPELRKELEYSGAIFQTTIDSEVIAYHVARERVKTPSVEAAVANAMKKIVGAYSLVVMSPRKLIGARDPYGFKPLCIGKRDNAYIIVSESCALDTVGAEFVRDVLPGEIVTITKDGIVSDTSLCFKERSKEARCVFEYIYFARPDSVFDGVSVYHSRLCAGRALAVDSPVEADVVVGVPESGNAAALGYSLQSGIPYGTAFVKNSYVGRTFIKPKQSNRESSVRIKLNVLKEAVVGKRVIMIDDSIVRGTTSALIVNMLREAGASEVHVRISAPPFLHPCYFGTDIPDEDQLIAHNRSIDEIRDVLGADSLSYLNIERLNEMAERLPICTACFSGNYPIEPPKEDIRGEYSR
ncbi:MAG: amidophosphoribosyltransferase [Lacrimispora sp.]|nr:amidophosphoribosyltransferase [Lacrimispora sp.]